MTHKTMTPTTTISPMKGKEYLAPYHPTTMPGKSTIPIVDIFSEESPKNEFSWQEYLLINRINFVCGLIAVVVIHAVVTHIGMGKFNENNYNLEELYKQKKGIFDADKNMFMEFMQQKYINLKNCYSLSSAEYSSGLKALDVFKKFHEDLQDTALEAVKYIKSQADNEVLKSEDFFLESLWISLPLMGVIIALVLPSLEVHPLFGKTVMELLSDTIDQVSAGASSVAQTMGDAMELASETMDRWLAGANDYSEYEFELDGAAPDVAGAECPIFIEDALLADGAVPELIVYPHSIAL